MTRTDRRRLIQRIAFSESHHFSWDNFPANTMAYERELLWHRNITYDNLVYFMHIKRERIYIDCFGCMSYGIYKTIPLIPNSPPHIHQSGFNLLFCLHDPIPNCWGRKVAPVFQPPVTVLLTSLVFFYKSGFDLT